MKYRVYMSFLVLFSSAAVVMAHEKPRAPAPDQSIGSTSYSASLFHGATTYLLADGRGLSFSKNNDKLLVTSDSSGVFNAVVLQDDRKKKMLTDSKRESLYAKSFFPNDDRVLLQGDQGGNEADHVFVLEQSGEIRDLTPGDGLKAEFLGWRTDGGVFYVATNERDAQSFDIYAYDSQSYVRTLIFENNLMNIGAISPDGLLVALTKQHSNADSDIYLANLSDAEPKLAKITAHEGEVEHRVHTFTPDSSKLVYGTNEFSEYRQAWTYDIGKEERQPLIVEEWDVTYVGYSPTGRYRVSAVNEDAVTKVSIHDSETHRSIGIDGVPNVGLAQFRFGRGDTHVAFVVTTDTLPSDIYIAELPSGRAHLLTSSLPAEIDESNLVDGQIVRYPSFDGLEIPGILYMPTTAGAHALAPAVVFVHGGPGGQSVKRYSATVQYLVYNGYAVLAVNNRGSNGYGKTFSHMDDRDHGGGDLMDVLYARKFLETIELVDSDRVGVMGGSYGGFITLSALAFYPDVFDVGVNLFGVTNWERTLKNIPSWWGARRNAIYSELGDPRTDSERHRRISPLFHTENITKPLYVAQGANDPRVLQIESDEVVAAVRQNNVPVVYVLFPDEGHGFVKRANRIINSERIVAFLNAHLRPSGARSEN